MTKQPTKKKPAKRVARAKPITEDDVKGIVQTAICDMLHNNCRDNDDLKRLVDWELSNYLAKARVVNQKAHYKECFTILTGSFAVGILVGFMICRLIF